MSQIYNVYCDESCHLPNDRQPVMVLGAVFCPAEKAREANTRLREIKNRNGLASSFELKWTKVSPAKWRYYLDVADYFFDDDDLRFRGLVAHGKDRLNHPAFNQDHDTWYYKMYFDMLRLIINPAFHYRIFLDIKDSRSADKTRKLHEVLSNSIYDFRSEIIETVQTVRSHEVELLQLADLLIGALAYLNRNLSGSSAKNEIITRLKKRTGYSLTRSTLMLESKFNIFHWQPQEGLR